MTKKLLLAAAAVSAIGFAGAANAQVISSVTVSGQARAQNNVAPFTAPAGVADAWTGGVVTAPGTTAAAVADTKYLVALESQATALNRSTAGAASTTARYLSTGTAGANVLGLLGGNTYQVTLSLTGAKFSNSVPATAISFVDGAGAATALVTGATVVSGGASGDSSVTIQFTVDGTVTGRTALLSVAGFTINHPFTVDSYAPVSVSVNTALVVGTGYTGAGQSLATVIGTSAQRTRTIVDTVSGYEFVAGGVANAAAGANAFTSTVVGANDRLMLGATAPAFRTFDGANDGIASVSFRTKAQDGTNVTALVGLTGNTVPAVTYDVKVDALTGVFGTTVNSLRPGSAAGTGNYTVATGGASASSAGVTGGTVSTVFIGQGAGGTPTASLATVDQRYSVSVSPQTSSAGLVTLPAARTFNAQNLTLEGSSYLAPWVTSSAANYNSVLRIANNGARAIGPVELSLSSPRTVTSSSSNVCRAADQAALGSIAVGGELVINSTMLTACFGEFTRGDLTVRILDTVPAGALSGKLRIVSPTGIISEQSLGAGL